MERTISKQLFWSLLIIIPLVGILMGFLLSSEAETGATASSIQAEAGK